MQVHGPRDEFIGLNVFDDKGKFSLSTTKDQLPSKFKKDDK
jgi:hypothetical protein